MTTFSQRSGINEIRLEREEVVLELSKLFHTMWQEQMGRIVRALDTESNLENLKQGWRNICVTPFHEISEWRNLYYTEQADRTLDVLDAVANLQRARGGLVPERRQCNSCQMLGAFFSVCEECGNECCDNCMNLSKGRPLCVPCNRRATQPTQPAQEEESETRHLRDLLPEEFKNLNPALTRPVVKQRQDITERRVLSRAEKDEQAFEQIERDCGLPEMKVNAPMPPVKSPIGNFVPKSVRRRKAHVFQAYSHEPAKKNIYGKEMITTDDMTDLKERVDRHFENFSTDETETPAMGLSNDDEVLPSERWRLDEQKKQGSNQQRDDDCEE